MTTTPDTSWMTRRASATRPVRFDVAMQDIHRDFLYVRTRLGSNAPVVRNWQALRESAWAAETATDPAQRTAVVDRWRELSQLTQSRRGRPLVGRAVSVTVDVDRPEHLHAVYARAARVRMVRINALLAHLIVGVALITAWAWPVYLQVADLGWLVNRRMYDTAPERLRTGFDYGLWLASAVSIVFAVTATLFTAAYLWGDRRHRNGRVTSVASVVGVEVMCGCLILIAAALFLAVPA